MCSEPIGTKDIVSRTILNIGISDKEALYYEMVRFNIGIAL